jgi:hypothetical protein
MAELAAGAPALGEARAWIGHGVDDLGGSRVGEAQGLFGDAKSGEPSWLIVKLGRRGPLVAVPLRDCAAGGGNVWVAHGRDVIRSSPVVDPTRPLLREHELTICAHFGIGERVGRAAEVVGRAEGSIASRPV